MATDVITTIGATSSPITPDYTSLQAWEDDITADLVSTDERHIGECLEQGEFISSSILLTISGQTTDSTHNIILRCATGASFKDKTSVRTVALNYSAANGVAIRATGNYTKTIFIETEYCKLDGLQIKGQALNTEVLASNYTSLGGIIQNCLIVSSVASSTTVAGVPAGGKFINNLVIVSISNSTAILEANTANGEVYGNTLISAGSTGTCINIGNYYSRIIKNNACFGQSSFSTGSATTTGSGYNATNHATAIGTNNQTSLTFADQFESITNDFRAKSTGDLQAGTPDLTNTPDDITGTTRDAVTPWIGAWEYVYVASPTFNLLRKKSGAINLGSPVNWASPLNTGLVSWWLALNQGPYFGGSRFLDLCQNSHGSLTVNPTWQGTIGRPGGFGSLYHVNGATPDFTVGTLKAEVPIYTMSVWTCPTVSNAGTCIVVGNHLIWYRTGANVFAVQENEGAYNSQLSTVTPDINVWYHVTATCAGTSAGDIKIYVNGIDCTSGTTALIAMSGTNISINRNAGFSVQTQYADDFCVFNRVLSATEVYARYQDSLQGYPTTLNRFYRNYTFDVRQTSHFFKFRNNTIRAMLRR